MGNAVGQLVGALACGWPLERFGRKRTLAACCFWSIAWIFMQFFSTNLTILCIGEIFAGLGYGFYVVIAPVYASDVCPLALRGVLTASVNLAFVIGQFIAQGTAAGVESRTDALAYKLPFGEYPMCDLVYTLVDSNDSYPVDLARRSVSWSLLRTREPLLVGAPRSQNRCKARTGEVDQQEGSS
jgi:MFS family permease